MASSTQNIWLKYLITERLERTSSHGASTSVKYRELIDRTQKTLDKPVQLQAMILATLAESLVAVIPSGKGHVSFIHSFYEGGSTEDDRRIIGLSGFDPAATLRTVKPPRRRADWSENPQPDPSPRREYPHSDFYLPSNQRTI
jgi:hypothetical protein